jgi:hypothetical protein
MARYDILDEMCACAYYVDTAVEEVWLLALIISQWLTPVELHKSSRITEDLGGRNAASKPAELQRVLLIGGDACLSPAYLVDAGTHAHGACTSLLYVFV